MKIAAKVAEEKYLVEMSSDEIARCAGYASAWGWRRVVALDPGSPFKVGEEFKVGTIVDFTACYSYLEKLRANESQVRSQVKFLRTMADMLDGAMPTTFLPPEQPLEAPK